MTAKDNIDANDLSCLCPCGDQSAADADTCQARMDAVLTKIGK